MKHTPWVRVFSSTCLLAAALWAIFAALPSRMGSAGFAAENHCRGEAIVSLRPGRDIRQINARHGTYVKERIPNSNDYLLGLPAGADTGLCVRNLQADLDLFFADHNRGFPLPEVRQVSQAFIDQVSQAFIDGQSPLSFYGQPAVLRIRVAEAQAYSRGLGVRVAVIDTGIDFNHPLFARRIALPVYDFVDNDTLPADEPGGAGSGHGTFVAGLIARAAPDATIMPLRAFNRDGVATSFNIARAIRFAADNGAKAINMSFGLTERDESIRGAMDYAYARSHMIASAGNANLDDIQYPAGERNRALSVTSTTTADVKAPFANYHRSMETSSPGVLLYSAYPGGRWAWWSGTSFSTALVTGEAALLLALRPNLGPGELKQAIVNSGANIDSLNGRYARKVGRRIDYRAAIQRLIGQ